MKRRFVYLLIIAVLLAGCTRSADAGAVWIPPAPQDGSVAVVASAGGSNPTPFYTPTRSAEAQLLTPTPNAPHAEATPRTETESYVIQAGDQLSAIAEKYGVSLDELVAANEIADTDHIEVGQTLLIPVPSRTDYGPSFKVIPDSELIASPTNAQFDTAAYINAAGGYLASYEEEVDGVMVSGAEIVQRISEEYSVNPRLLLAVLEYQSGWVTSHNPNSYTLDYPMGMYETGYDGLYTQLAWAAASLNSGYYTWEIAGVASWILNDGSMVPIATTINPGTAGVQHLFALLYSGSEWETAVTENGLYATYESLFGYPFDMALEPLVPADLTQPTLQLPFEMGVKWYLTGGPHSGWDAGSAWAAVDFAPPGEELGCFETDEWIVAMADGLIVTAENGRVVQDLDGDGYFQTGWSILYMHIESKDRVAVGTYLHAGDRIGHASCEGGVSNGTHTHLARRYNGVWIAADGSLPFNMDGWISSGTGTEYDGYMTRNGTTLEAWEGRFPENEIQR